MSAPVNSNAITSVKLKAPTGVTLERDFIEAVSVLANDQPLAEKHRDHALTGDWKDHRDCHVKPDLLLIYRKPNAEVLQLVRLGSHSKLGF